MEEKSTFRLLFVILSIALLLLPLVTTFNEFLTRVVMEVKIYRLIQNFIVPFEARMVAAVLRLVRIEAYPTPISVNIGKPTTIGNDVIISWNCIGWQSFILLLITLGTGLQGSFRLFTKIQTIIIGVLGTFLFNILRVSLVIIIAQQISSLAAIIFHDYLSTLMIIFWLFGFWWFVYSFVLEREAGAG